MRRLLIIAPLLLVACASEQPVTESPAAADAGIQIRALSTAQVYSPSGSSITQREMADLLFAALQALDADRLLTPVDDNAHARFKRALAYDPDNEIALQGLEDIVLRYIELAEEASHQGLFEEAEILLDRARFVDKEHPQIAAAAELLQTERESGDLFFNFDAGELAGRSETAQSKLVSIAEQAREHNAFFLITAPNDELARWMFSVMREAVDGYRLRGNIELANRGSVRLRLPDQES